MSNFTSNEISKPTFNIDRPLISIVTVVYNSTTFIEQTILSVLACGSYKNLEYIVIDGGSTDGTVDVIRKYNSQITRWLSEPDKGIYDAMNKGANLATGEYIYFLNAGDVIYKDVFSEIFQNPKTIEFDVIYGDIINSTNKHKSKGANIDIIKYELPFCHQSVLVKCSLQKQFGFDLKYKIAADYDLFRKLYTKGYSFQYIQLVFGEIDGEGVSNTNFKQVIMEYISIQWSYNKFISVLKYIAYKKKFISYLIIKNSMHASFFNKLMALKKKIRE